MKSCFVISPIGEDRSPARLRSDKIIRHIIEPVTSLLGYAPPLRADQLAAPGIITTQVIEHVLRDDLVIADLSGANPNVFYELAVRHVVRQPLIQLIAIGESIPFDVAGSRTIFIDETDLDKVDTVKVELRNQILAVEEHPEQADNPISVSVDLAVLRGSENPTAQAVVALAAELAEMKEDVRAIRHDTTVFNRLQTWNVVLEKMQRFEKILESRSVEIASDLEMKVEDLTYKVDGLEDDLSDLKK